FRISPGAGIAISWRRRPVLPPSSATVTSAVRSTGRFFKPRKSTGMPVPPPITTIRGFSLLILMPLPFVNVPMADMRNILIGKLFFEMLGNCHGTVLATRASDSDDKLGFGFFFILWVPERQ